VPVLLALGSEPGRRENVPPDDAGVSEGGSDGEAVTAKNNYGSVEKVAQLANIAQE
jgi:hypothetical protein